ncbi:hypothetical protein [Microbacterium sp.]|uniref:hypothetical protein n=1 Tax=Microbacterium sp. TaxID=51671 RepID=UPI003A9476CB
MSSAPSRSSPFSAALHAAADAVVAATDRHARTVVLIDGRSGAGKSTLARLIVRQWPQAQLVALDSLYPGWDGLDAGAELARTRILQPHRRGEHASWPRWDWAAGAPGEEHDVDPGAPLIVEGSGILTPQTATLADVRVWLDAPDAQRKQRALDRDGELYRPFWDRWAAQEERHIARDGPQALATHVFRVP